MTHKTIHFIRHYVEMVVAMFAGMLVLGGAAVVLLGLDTGSLYDDAPAVGLTGMALTMTIPMVAWMRYRGHDWGPTREMAASMFVPAFVAMVLVWVGIAGGTGTLMVFEHVAMLAGMLAVMLLRRDEYSGSAHVHPATA